MSNEQIKQQATGWLQLVLSLMLFALILVDAFLPDWELDWKAYIILGFGALGARPETVAGIFGLGKNGKT